MRRFPLATPSAASWRCIALSIAMFACQRPIPKHPKHARRPPFLERVIFKHSKAVMGGRRRPPLQAQQLLADSFHIFRLPMTRRVHASLSCLCVRFPRHWTRRAPRWLHLLKRHALLNRALIGLASHFMPCVPFHVNTLFTLVIIKTLFGRGFQAGRSHVQSSAAARQQAARVTAVHVATGRCCYSIEYRNFRFRKYELQALTTLSACTELGVGRGHPAAVTSCSLGAWRPAACCSGQP